MNDRYLLRNRTHSTAICDCIIYYIYLKCHLFLSCLLYYIHSIRIRHMHDGVFKADRQQFIR